MSVLVRLFEKLTGRPHKHENARIVSEVADSLSQDIDHLSSILQPYTQADDPLVALMTDVFNQRQMRGNGVDGKREQ